METLIDRVIAAHGGMEQWKKFNHISVHLKIDGQIWIIKGKPGLLREGIFEANIHQQESGYHSLLPPHQRSTWANGKITLTSDDIKGEEVLLNPRRSFDGQPLETKWNDLQPHYFSNYAWWTYFTSPFNFTLPGFQLRELGPWQQDGGSWQMLEVTFPDYIETHNKVQVFYYDEKFLLRRHDYAPDILASVPSSHYVWDFKDFMGIKIPVTRRIYLRNADSGFNPEPVMVSIDVVDVIFS